MCFYQTDGDWYAEVNDAQWKQLLIPTAKCYECGRVFSAPTVMYEIWQQEYEECQICEYDDHIDPLTCEHDYGETAFYRCCAACYDLRQAVIAREKLEGCPEGEQQPGYGALAEAFATYNDDAKHYADFAVKMFPSLDTHPFVRFATTGKT